ncbi:MAG: DUF2339 domain-containing protein [Deltaproteobacteria bacterium]|nr:DUF2339 domain-containing protein [Deltaproteobacteria bacterium]
METFFVGIFVVGFFGTTVVGSVLGIIAFARGKKGSGAKQREIDSRLDYLEHSLGSLIKRIRALEVAAAARAATGTETAESAESAELKNRIEKVSATETTEGTEENPRDSRLTTDDSRQRADSASFQPPLLPAADLPAAGLPPPASSPEPQAYGADFWSRFEAAVGKRWITWAGALVLFFGVGFFVKYAFDNQWIGPTARVAVGICAGVAMLFAGDRFVRRGWRALGLGLLGAGLAVMYVSVFAAFSIYDLLPQSAAFAALVVVTAAGAALALLHNAISVSIIALLGGLLTPVMVSTGQNARDGLFAYLLLLDLGVLFIAFFRRWRSLDALAFAGTWVLYAGWFSKFYDAPQAAPAVAWLAAFYLVFLVLPFAYHLRRAEPVTVERFVMAAANAAVAFGFSWRILKVDHQVVLGFAALLMSAGYIVMGSLARRRIPDDARSLFGFVTLAVTFLTMAVPLHLGLHGITLAWAVEAPALLYLGFRYAYPPLRVGAFLVLVLAVARLFFSHWPLHTAYFTPVFNAPFASAVSVPLAGAAFALVHRLRRADAARHDEALKTAAAIGSGILALVVVNAETTLWLTFSRMESFAACAPAIVWGLGAFAFVFSGIKLGSAAARLTGLFLLVVTAATAAQPYLSGWGPQQTLVANTRFACALFALAAFVSSAAILRRNRGEINAAERALPAAVGGASAVFLFLLLSAETWTYFSTRGEDRERADWTAQMALSIVWGGYAGAMLLIGFWRRLRPLRIAALGLFGLTALKLVVVDMANLRQIYRIASFVVIGVLMIAASYLYHRLEKRLGDNAPIR